MQVDGDGAAESMDCDDVDRSVHADGRIDCEDAD